MTDLTINPDRIVQYCELKPVWGIKFSRPHLARLEKAGKFPQRLTYGSGSVGWLTSEIAAHLAARAAARQAVAA
jgi:prophage regulatory protein